MKKVNKANNDIEKRNKNLKALKIGMIVLDIFAIANLIFQIIIKDVSYMSFITIILCNIIVFATKIKE